MIYTQIFKAIVGSTAYGTSIDSVSDIDYKSVHVQHPDEILCFGYKEQIDYNKDECSYEIRKFIQLLKSANPTALELLFSPNDCIIYKHPSFNVLIDNRHKFLTKKSFQSFGNYAHTQIKKARGLDKKLNWEKQRIERRLPIDFCYIYQNGKTKPLLEFLSENSMKQEFCGIAALNHFRDCFALYYDNTLGGLHFRSVVSEDSNDVRVSSIPKELEAKVILYYNKDGYTMHCKDYKEYQVYLENRNINRYVDVKNHNQQLDGKNLLHCRRLLDMALEIATNKTISVKRENAVDLLKIRKGEYDLNSIISKAEEDILLLSKMSTTSDLPDDVSDEFVDDMLLAIRKEIYSKI